MQQTYSLPFAWFSIPRALPWVSMHEPVGLIGRAICWLPLVVRDIQKARIDIGSNPISQERFSHSRPYSKKHSNDPRLTLHNSYNGAQRAHCILAQGTALGVNRHNIAG